MENFRRKASLIVIVFIMFTVVWTAYSQVGIGTVTPDPTSALDVDGVIRSSSLVPTATSGSKVYADPNGRLILYKEDFVKGKVNPNGTAANIVGATVSRLGVGRYKIDFVAPKPNDYIIMLSHRKPLVGNRDFSISYLNQANLSFEVEVRDNDDGGGNGTLRDIEFMFVIH